MDYKALYYLAPVLPIIEILIYFEASILFLYSQLQSLSMIPEFHYAVNHKHPVLTLLHLLEFPCSPPDSVYSFCSSFSKILIPV